MGHPPIWRAIEAEIRDEIVAAGPEPGRKLPSEQAYAARFGANRHTVRRALGALENAGLVEVRRGSGVFVAEGAPAAAAPAAAPRRLALDALGLDGEQTLIGFAVEPADAAAAAALGLKEGATVIRASAWAGSAEAPFAFIERRVSARRFPDFLDTLEHAGGVDAALRRYGIIRTVGGGACLTAGVADDAVARRLKIRVGAPVLTVATLYRDAAGQAVDYVVTALAGERVAIAADGPAAPVFAEDWAGAEDREAEARGAAARLKTPPRAPAPELSEEPAQAGENRCGARAPQRRSGRAALETPAGGVASERGAPEPIAPEPIAPEPIAPRPS